jgi:polysaccharide biosynthesis/export protein
MEANVLASKRHCNWREVIMKKIVIHAGLALLLVIAAAAQDKNNQAAGAQPASASAPRSADANSNPAFSERHPRYQVRPGDAFDLNFEFSPELNQSLTVQPDGYIPLREVGDVYVAGLTVPELTDQVKKSYSKILHDPVITVVLRDFDKPYFVAGGQLARPGKYELRSETTLTQAIAIAGGFTQASKHSQVVLYHRVSPDMYEAKLIDVKKMMAKHDLREDARLQSGDMIFVPQNTISKIQKFLPVPVVSSAMNPSSF